jgi:hypothetical protein
MQIPADKQYEHLTTHLRYLNDKILEAFNHFITLASAIIGGTFYIHVNLAASDPRRSGLANPSSALLSVVGTGIIIMIVTNLLAWHRYRATLSKVFPEIPLMRKSTAWLSETAMCVLIAITCVGFWLLNPL